MLMCDPEVGGCRPIGQGLSVLVFRDGAYMLKPLDDGRQELMEGDVGEDVRELQQALVDRGYDIEVDGQFGPGTAAAVEAFQKSALLEVSGTTPVATLGALGLGGGLVADFSSIEGWSDALIRYLTYGEQGRLPSAAVKGLSGFVYETSDAVPFSRLAAEPRSDGRTLLALVGQDSRGYGPALILDVCITSAPALDWCGFWSAAND
jgi:peptidoglycan hydrolase-like protein with peptidoglycan-binding domain